MDRICSQVKGETSINNVIGIHNIKVKDLFNITLLEKRATIRHNMKQYHSETKQLKTKCRTYDKKWLIAKITYIRNMLKDCSSFVLDREKELGMTEFSEGSESCVEMIIGDSKAMC